MAAEESDHMLVWVACFRPWPLNSLYPLNGRLPGPQSWSGHLREEKRLLPVPGIKPQIVHVVRITDLKDNMLRSPTASMASLGNH